MLARTVFDTSYREGGEEGEEYLWHINITVLGLIRRTLTCAMTAR